MFKKEIKERFRDMIIRQAKLAAVNGDFDICMWICLYYFDGLNDAIYTTKQYGSAMDYISSENFRYIFHSIVEFRKGVR